MSTTAQTLHFGVLIVPNYQLLDAIGPVDYINSHSRDYLKDLQLDDALIAKGPIMHWHWIAATMDPVQPTSGPPQNPTCTYATCPELDYLIVPGPDPKMVLAPGCAEFLQALMAKESFKALLTVCTGSMSVAQSGILDGYRVCSNKFVLKLYAEAGMLNKNVVWIGDRRWNVDGKVWSAAGVTSGLDLAAEFCRVHFDPVLVAVVQDASEYEPKPAQPDVFARILDGVAL